MSCDQFLQSCYNNCTDNTAFKDACDTCPPDTCSNFLKLCNGNCTDDSAFEDACIESCPTPASSYILLGLLIVGILYCLWKNDYFKKWSSPGDKGSYGTSYGSGRGGQGKIPVVQAQPVVPVVQAQPVRQRGFDKYVRAARQRDFELYKKYYGRPMSQGEKERHIVAQGRENDLWNYFEDDDGRVIESFGMKIRPSVEIGLKQGLMYPQEQLNEIDIQNMNTKKERFITHDGWLVQKKDLKIVGQTRGALNQPMVF